MIEPRAKKEEASVPSVSIVVPVKNGESTIEELLDSLQKLDCDKRNVEVVIVDGNSRDATRDIVQKYPFRLVLEKRAGLNVARNSGIKNSSGEIIAFTDSDCMVANDWIKRIVRDFEDSSISCVAGNANGCEDGFFSEYADESMVPVMPSFEKREKLDMIKLFRNPAGCNIALRRKAVEEVGYFDEAIKLGFDEIELIERICRAGHKILVDPKVLVRHKHRSTLKDLLKQNFRYGRGSGFLLKRKKMKDMFSTWSFLSLIGSLVWISMIGLLPFFTMTTPSIVFPILLFEITVLPLIVMMVLYTSKISKSKKQEKLKKVIFYPFIDLLRAITFCAGEIYQFFLKGSSDQKTF